jgi:hypothetical protein
VPQAPAPRCAPRLSKVELIFCTLNTLKYAKNVNR